MLLSDLTTAISRLQGSTGTGNAASNDSVFSAFAKQNVASVDLSNGNLIIRDNFDIQIDSDGESQVIQAMIQLKKSSSLFDEERYSLIRSDGSTEALTSDKFIFTVGSTQLQLKDCVLILILN